jgi:hypothetical protein
MDRLHNSLEDVQVGGVERITDPSTAPWRRYQQLQRWKIHMQRLGQALESGNIAQARSEFHALMNDVSEFGQADPMANPNFGLIGKALESLDLAGAREAFTHLQNEVHFLHQHHDQHHATQPPEPQAENLPNEDEDSSDPPRILDVTA